ncbi:MAG: dTDP-glucose 4,6-dehydratase [Alphaproteobacteria bacterium]
MKILLTGGAGFIGSNFLIHAIKAGYEVVNVDVLTYAGNLNNLEDYKNHPGHHFYQENICNTENIKTIFQHHKPDVVLHMAAESHVDRSIDCPDPFIETNILGTYSMLEASLDYYKSLSDQSRFRFIHLSTDEVFGALGMEEKFSETSPYRPNSPYAASKASSDLLVRSYFKTYNFPTVIVNASNNYGPRQYAEKLIPLIILNAIEHKPLPLYGNGLQVRDWLYVEDHVDALSLLIEKGKVGESYCIGAENEFTNLSLVNKICDILDAIYPSSKLDSYKDLITFVTDRPGHDFRYATDASKLKTLGWQPKTDLDEGLEKTVRWYLACYTKGGHSQNNRIRIGLGK